VFRLAEERPGVCTIGYDDAYNAVVITWTRNDNEAFQPMLELQLRLVVEHDAAVVIVDTTDATGALNDTNQTWLATDFFPMLACTGLAALINVLPRSATAVLVNRRSFRGREVPFAIVEATTLDEAYTMATSYRPGVPA
jgi:hypothetical protein